MRIEVTRADIQKGRRGDCYSCPLALAIGRALDLPVEIWSHQVVIQNRTSRAFRVVKLPPIAQRFIAGFDTNKIKQPTCPGFEFELDMDSALDVTPTFIEGQD